MDNAINYWYQKYLQEKEKNQGIKSNDLEDFAKKESESFAEREYEIGYIDRNALAKGYYWGCIAGAQWQKQRTDEAMTEALRTEYEKGRADAFAQMQKEWSEEDEKIKEDILYDLNTLLEDSKSEWAIKDLKKEINWIESLKPQTAGNRVNR